MNKFKRKQKSGSNSLFVVFLSPLGATNITNNSQHS